MTCAAILKELISKCVPGTSVLELCEYGDRRLMEETGKVFKKDKEMKKGETFVVKNLLAVVGFASDVVHNVTSSVHDTIVSV